MHLARVAARRGALATFKVPREIRFADEMPHSVLKKAQWRKMPG